MADSEISMNVKIDGPAKLEKELAKFANLTKAIQGNLAHVANDIKDYTDATKTLLSRAQSTGSASLTSLAKGSFDNVSASESMGANYDAQSRRLEQYTKKVDELNKKVADGSISQEKATEQLKRYNAEMARLTEQSSNLVTTYEATKWDFANSLPGIDEMLAKYAQFTDQTNNVLDSAKRLREELLAQANAYREQLEALDSTAPGYAKQAEALQRSETNARNLAEATSKVIANTEKTVSRMQAMANTVNASAQSQAKFTAELNKNMAAYSQMEERVSTLTAKRDLQDQQRENTLKKLSDAEQARAAKEAYQLELATKNRRELAQVIRELGAAMKAAANASDTEALKKYEQQLGAARSQMRKLNMQANMTRMLFAQQAQVGQRVASNFQTLTTGLGDFSKAAEKGELNITGMASAFIDMGLAIKAGLGPLALAMGALQLAQNTFNSYAKTKQKVAEAEKQNVEILQAEKDLYNELATARADYNAQIALATTLQDINTEYDGIKTKLQDSLHLIEANTRAELARLALVKEEEEYTRIQKRYELGRAFKRGEISDDEYRKQIIELDKQQAIAEAHLKLDEALEKRKQALQGVTQKKGVAKQADSLATHAEAYFNSFSVTDSEINIVENKIQEQRETIKKINDEIKKFLVELGWPEAEADAIVKEGDIQAAIINSPYYRDRSSLGQKFVNKLINAAPSFRNRQNALNNISAFQGELNDMLGGRSIAEYKRERDKAEQIFTLRRTEADTAQRAYEDAQRDFDSLPTRDALNKDFQSTLKNIRFIAGEKIKDVDNDIEIRKADAARLAALNAVKNKVGQLTTDQLSKARKKAESGLWTDNDKDYQNAVDILNEYDNEINRRQELRTSSVAKYLGDKIFDSKEVTAVLKMYDTAVTENNQAMKEVAAYLLRTGRKYIETTEDLKRTNNKLRDME